MNVPSAFENTAPPRPQPHASRRRPFSRFSLWAWSPIISFQVGLTAGYLALVWFGISSIIAAPPTLTATTPREYAGFWAIALLVGAAIAALGSINRRKPFEHIERVGSTLVSLTVGSYTAIITWLAFGQGDVGRIAGSAGFTALAVPLIIRTLWLWSQLLRRK